MVKIPLKSEVFHTVILDNLLSLRVYLFHSAERRKLLLEFLKDQIMPYLIFSLAAFTEELGVC